MRDYRKLDCWHAAVHLAVRTRAMVDTFPRRGYSELKAQMVSSAESVANVIAEGSPSESDAEFVRYLEMAVRSTTELGGQIDLATEYKIVSRKEAFALIGTAVCTRRMIKSLQVEVRAKMREGQTAANNTENKRRPRTPRTKAANE